MSKSSFIQIIYEKVNAVLGNDNQLFMMEFPARALNPNDFEYSTQHRTSMITKPYTVREKEFRLVDDLFNVSRITGGPTGEKLSTVYETIINNYVPSLQSYVSFAKDKVLARHWLMEEIEFTDHEGKPTQKSRIAFSEELMIKYLDAKLEWERKKKAEFDRLKNDAESKTKEDKADVEALNQAMDDYAEWISSTGLIEEEKLNQLYNDVVVRGNLHEVLTLLGFLNASTTAEALESTKQFMRNSARLSMDGASKIYPVNLNPSNWFQALRPNFSPKDLTMSREALAMQYRSKVKSLDDLKQHKAELETMHVADDQVKQVTEKVRAAEQEARTAETKFLNTQTEATLQAAKIAYAAARAGTKNDVPVKTEDFRKQIKSLSSEEKKDTVLDQIFTSIKDVSEKLDVAVAAKANLSSLMAKEAMLKSHNFQAQIQKINAQIDILTADIQYLEPLVAGALSMHAKEESGDGKKKPELHKWLYEKMSDTFPAGDIEKILIKKGTKQIDPEKMTVDTPEKKKYEELIKEYATLDAVVEKPLLPDQGLSVSDLSFTDIIISSSDVKATSAKTSEASASNSGYRAGGWFANYSYSNSQSSAQTSFESEALSSEFECGFRVAKVAIDRGGWFNPSLLKMSNAFFRLADVKGGGGLTMAHLNADHATLEMKTKGVLLPAYPVAFIIAKDITFKLSGKSTVESFSSKNSAGDSSWGGGFGPFSASGASSHSQTSETAYSGVHADSVYIRIPGPQILGWYMQFTPEDLSLPYSQDNALKSSTLSTLLLCEETILAEIRKQRRQLEPGTHKGTDTPGEQTQPTNP